MLDWLNDRYVMIRSDWSLTNGNAPNAFSQPMRE